MRAPFQRVTDERRPVVGQRRRTAAGTKPRLHVLACERHGVVRIFAGNHLEYGDGIFDRACHRTRDVGEQVQRRHPRSARQPHRRADAHQALVRGRAANRVARVAAETHRAEVRRHGSRRSAARARGDAIEGVRILRVAGEDRADRLVWRKGELRHVRLREHDRAGSPDALHLERVACSTRIPSATASRRRSAIPLFRNCL